MAEKETVILDFQIEQGDAISELEKTKKSIIGLKQEQQELNKAYKQGNVTIDEYASESVRLEGILKKQTNQYNTLQKSTAGVVTQFDKLVAANQKIAKNVGEQNEKFKEFATNVNVGGTSVGDLTGKLSAFLNPATAAAGAVSALAGFYLSSAAGARDLENAQNQLSSSFRTVSNDLARLLGADGSGGGPLSKFAEVLNNIIFGPGASIRGGFSAEARDRLKELELLQLQAQGVAKQALSDAEKLRRIRDDDTKSISERLEAARKVEGFVNVRQQVLVNVQRDRLTQLTKLLAENENDLELQKEILQTRFEIRDIEEDSEGKRTEALNGINALLREQKQITQETSSVKQRDIELGGAELKQLDLKIKSKIDENAAINAVTVANKKQAASVEALIAKQQAEQALAEARLSTFGQLASLISVIAGSNKDLAVAGIALDRATAISQIISNTGIANAKAVAASPLTFGQPFVGINTVSAALSVATIVAQAVKSIGEVNAAAGGGKFMTKGPTMLLVGDNPGGVERVTVEPISGRGQTKVSKNGNLVAMAGGGVLETQSVTNPINQSFALSGIMDKIEVVASWKEATELESRIRFKEALTQI